MSELKYNVKSIVELLSLHSEKQPDALAVADKKNSLTYRELFEAACRGSVYLKKQGIVPGDKIILQGVQKAVFVVALFSAHLCGASVCPLENAVKSDRIEELFNILDASICITEKPLEGSGIKSILYRDLWREATNGDIDIPEPVFPNGKEISEILFTTGTTGKSKGIVIDFITNLYIAENVIDSVEMLSDERELITTPINHSLAIRRTYGAIYNGSGVVFSEGFKFANTFFGLIQKYNITAITLVPAIFEQIIVNDKDTFSGFANQLRYIQFGSAPLSETNKAIIMDMFPGVRLYNTYGATESACTVILEFSKYKDRKNCIGRKTVHTELILVDDNRQVMEASPENPGLFAFKGGMNMSYYYKDPEETLAAIDENGIVYTNDLGYIGEDGLIYLLGRRGDVINMGGIKIAPTEIENVAKMHPMIKDCACIPVKDRLTGEAPKLFIELEEGYEFDKKELMEFLLNRIEAIKIPKQYEVIEEIPRTFNGKIIRKELRRMEDGRDN